MAVVYYELWDLEAGNMMRVYDSQAAALAAVRAGVDEDGADLWRVVGLRVSGDDPADSRRIAVGDGLLVLAGSVAAAQEPPMPQVMTANGASG